MKYHFQRSAWEISVPERTAARQTGGHRGFFCLVGQADNSVTLRADGYDQRHVMEVLTMLAQKTLSNYYNHIANTPLDDMFMTQQWSPAR